MVTFFFDKHFTMTPESSFKQKLKESPFFEKSHQRKARIIPIGAESVDEKQVSLFVYALTREILAGLGRFHRHQHKTPQSQ